MSFLPVEHRSCNRGGWPPTPAPPKNHLEVFRQACFLGFLAKCENKNPLDTVQTFKKYKQVYFIFSISQLSVKRKDL